MRIASLVPGATEMLFALGMGDALVARTHECRYPPEASAVTAVTEPIPGEPDTVLIDPHSSRRLDLDALFQARPDVIITEDRCPGCGSGNAGTEAGCSLPGDATVVVVDPYSMEEIAESMRTLGVATGTEEAATRLARVFNSQIDALRRSVTGRQRPRVVVVERPDPIWAPGRWVPELIEAAGGENVLGVAGQPSHPATAEELAEAQPEVILLALRGFTLYEAQARLRQLTRWPQWRATSRSARVLAIDAGAYFDRPGPMLVEGISLVAWGLHRVYPQGRPPTGRIAELIEAGWADLAALPTLAKEHT